MPDLSLLPADSSVFVDTNIFYYHFAGRSIACTTFLRRIAASEITAYVNTEVLSDLLHKMMLAEAFSLNIIRRPQAHLLKQRLNADRGIIANLPDHQVLFESLFVMGLKTVRITKEMLINTKRERSVHGLMTNDSLHLGSMVYHSVPIANLATKDSDFAHVPSITIWEPNDVI